MATTAGTLPSETSISRRILLWSIALFGILIVTGVLLVFNYWVAVIFFFVSLLILVRFGLKEYQARGLWFLLVLSLFIAFLSGSLVLLILSNNSRIPELAQSDVTANFFLGNNIRIVLTSILIGLIAPGPLVITPFLFVAVTTFGILQWQKKYPDISFFVAFWHLLTMLLGIFHFSLIVDNGELKGSEKDKERLQNYGGPGWLTVYLGQVVVLHKWGKFTRVVGTGSVMLKREEQIKSIVALTVKGGTNTIENVLTRDRIPLKITVSHAVQVEPATEMKTRLEQTVDEVRKQLQKSREDEKKIKSEIVNAEQNVKQIREKTRQAWKAAKVPGSPSKTKELFQKLLKEEDEKNKDLLEKIDTQKRIKEKILTTKKHLQEAEKQLLEYFPEKSIKLRQQAIDQISIELQETKDAGKHVKEAVKIARDQVRSVQKKLNELEPEHERIKSIRNILSSIWNLLSTTSKLAESTVNIQSNSEGNNVNQSDINSEPSQNTDNNLLPADTKDTSPSSTNGEPIEGNGNSQSNSEANEITPSVEIETTEDIKGRYQQELQEAKEQLNDAKAANKRAQNNIKAIQKQLNDATKYLYTITKARKEGHTIGDEYDQCYVSIARMVASKVSANQHVADIWDSMKGTIASNLRDVIMSCDFDDLFNVREGGANLVDSVNSRRIADIERTVLENAKGSALNKGLLIRSVDISEVRFPDQIEEKIKTEITALAEARINHIEANTRERTAEIENNIMIRKADALSSARSTEARGEQTAAIMWAEAIKIRAQAEAEAEMLRAKARAEYFKQIVYVLREQNQSEETIKTVLQHIASSSSTIHYIRKEQTINAAEVNGNQGQDPRIQQF